MNISEVSEFSILPYNQNRKLRNLGNMSLNSNSDSSYNLRFKSHKNMNWAENWKVPIWFKKKKEKSLRFPSFQFCPIPKVKNLEISEIRLARILTLIVTQDLKMPKKWTETKTKRFRYDLKQKIFFRDFQLFDFALYQNEKPRNLGNFLFTSNFDITCKLRLF